MATIGENIKNNFSDMMTYAKIIFRKSEHGDDMGGVFIDLAEEEIEKRIETFSPRFKLVFLKYIEKKVDAFCDKFRKDVVYEDVLNLDCAEYIEQMVQYSILTDLTKYLKTSQKLKKEGKKQDAVIENCKIIKSFNLLSDRAKTQLSHYYPRIMKKFKKFEKLKVKNSQVDYTKIK